jgi:hypothetical protein
VKEVDIGIPENLSFGSVPYFPFISKRLIDSHELKLLVASLPGQTEGRPANIVTVIYLAGIRSNLPELSV